MTVDIFVKKYSWNGTESIKFELPSQGIQITKWPVVEVFSNNSRNLPVSINWKSPIFTKNHEAPLLTTIQYGLIYFNVLSFLGIE